MPRFASTLAALAVTGLAFTSLPAAADPLEIGWADLIPASALIGERVTVLEGIVQHSQVSDSPETAAQTATSIEALMGISSPVEYRTDLEGAEVKIFGYVLPLAFEGTKVTEFLLVPFVGACIHVPAPPANQLVLVDMGEGFQSSGLWQPVVVTGTLSVSGISTDLAEIGYSLSATVVEGV